MLNMLMLSKNSAWLSLLRDIVWALVKGKAFKHKIKDGKECLFEFWSINKVVLDMNNFL